MSSKEMRSRDWFFDACLAASAFLFGCVQLLLAASSSVFRDEVFRTMMGFVSDTPTVWAYSILALTTAPLVLRRKFPWPVFVFTFVVYLVVQPQFRGYSITLAGPLVALFTVAEVQSRYEALVAMVVAIFGIIVSPTIAPNQTVDFYMKIQSSGLLCLAALAGLSLRTYHEYVSEVERRAQAAEESREAEAVARVEGERVRIAREIHDITAHSLSAVSVQAAAAERQIDTDPQAAKETIKQVRSTARGALEEIRSMIGVLRNEDVVEKKIPTQGTDRMNDVRMYLEDAGIEVAFDVSEYAQGKVPAYIGVALFGIAREAATNVVRHAQASKVHLRLSSDVQSANLLFEDDGVGMPHLLPEGTHGLQGMRERVNVLGGSMKISRVIPRGTCIEVSIPLEQSGARNE